MTVSCPAPTTNKSRREPMTRRRLILLILAVVVGGGSMVLIDLTKDYFILKRFSVVMPGFVYRSGAPQAWPLRRAIDEYQIGTVLTLLNEEPTRQQKSEQAVCEQAGVRMIRIPMPGDGLANYDDLEKAADIIATPANRPILVHCAAGVKRTGAAIVAYRLKYCAMQLQEALNECDQQGSPIADDQELVEHLRGFEDRIRIRHAAIRQQIESESASRPASAPATQPTSGPG